MVCGLAVNPFYEEVRDMKVFTHCDRCGVKLRRRKTLPATAARDGAKFWDYYQCPRCKVNVANPKGVKA